MTLNIKQFVSSAEGKPIELCADKVAVDNNTKRYAVADGVSASYMPEIWAGLLVDSFITSKIRADFFQEELEGGLLSELVEKWQVLVHEKEQEAEGIIARRYERNRRLFGQAASTLAGVSFENNIIYYYVLGDSCVFLVEDKELKVFSNVKDEESFNKTPFYIGSSKHMKGEAIVGHLNVSNDCWLLMMTDAMSEWFWHQQKKDSTTVQRLWSIKDQNDFETFIGKERESLLMDNDDVSLLIIHIVGGDGISDDIIGYSVDTKPSNSSDISSVNETDNREENTINNEFLVNQETITDVIEQTSINPDGQSTLVKICSEGQEDQSVKVTEKKVSSYFYLFMGLYRTYPKLFNYILSFHRYVKSKRN